MADNIQGVIDRAKRQLICNAKRPPQRLAGIITGNALETTVDRQQVLSAARAKVVSHFADEMELFHEGEDGAGFGAIEEFEDEGNASEVHHLDGHDDAARPTALLCSLPDQRRSVDDHHQGRRG